MAPYSAEQLALYFERIEYPAAQHASDKLAFLAGLIQYQLLSVPFENVSLHYSVDRATVSLEPHDLFEKIVLKGRGGYCFELNTFFAAVLRSLGFQVVSVICRMAPREANGVWRSMQVHVPSHMANLVTLDRKQYLVDIGYGVDGPSKPLPLVSGGLYDGLPSQELRLEYKNLPQHNDPGQRVWIYSQRRNAGAWEDVYHFLDAEFFAPDFAILNHYTATKSYWTQVVLAQRFVADESGRISGALFLFKDELKAGGGLSRDMDVVERFDIEWQRVSALEREFGIRLTEEEQSAIRGLVSEIHG